MVLSRRENDRILIGDDIVLVVLEIDKMRGRVRIGIEAPRDVLIRRHELLEQDKRREEGDGRERP